MMDALSAILLVVSNALLLPVMLGLLMMGAWMVLHLGGLLAEGIERRRARPWQQLMADLKADRGRTIARSDLPTGPGLIARGVAGPLHGKVLDDLQLDAEVGLARLTFGIRLGPMLGLAGTLIPLGPGLLALSSGDIRTLSLSLVVAFTTTVLGIVIGGGCYALHAIRHHWYRKDLSDLAFVADRLEAGS